MPVSLGIGTDALERLAERLRARNAIDPLAASMPASTILGRSVCQTTTDG